MTKERWHSFPKHIQILHIASEFSRSKHWIEKQDTEAVTQALNRAYDLIDHTISDKKWESGLKELLRFREELGRFYRERDARHFLTLYKILLSFTPQSARVKI